MLQGCGVEVIGQAKRMLEREMSETMREEVRLTKFSHGAG